MQDMLKKIIEMDEQARLVKEKAQLEKAATEKEIIETKKKIYDDYIERAKERVKKNLEVDKANAQKEWELTKAKHHSAMVQLDAMYEQNCDKWVDKIVDSVING
ncbi:MAG: hypothetical protein E7513_00390 [Ruminococcaceae bacterium]|nr:hypothetical protein [Oscillospiraceae bacterium]